MNPSEPAHFREDGPRNDERMHDDRIRSLLRGTCPADAQDFALAHGVTRAHFAHLCRELGLNAAFIF